MKLKDYLNLVNKFISAVLIIGMNTLLFINTLIRLLHCTKDFYFKFF